MTTPSATFFAEPPFSLGAHAMLGESEAHHIRVLRMNVGDRVALRDGLGHTAEGELIRIAKSQAVVQVDAVAETVPPPPIHLLLPVADRDRMLWLAEKAAELNVTSWRPVVWQRSKSVSPRGDGPTFRTKVRARMISALLQSRSAWLPELFPEATPERAIAAAPDGIRFVLDASGTPILQYLGSQALRPLNSGSGSGDVADETPELSPITLAIGPEGGFEPEELSQLAAAGFARCTLAPSVLRFETAAVAAIAVARSMQLHALSLNACPSDP